MFHGWEWSWGRAILGAAVGGLIGYFNQTRYGTSLWWLAVPALALLYGWHDPDDEGGPLAD